MKLVVPICLLTLFYNCSTITHISGKYASKRNPSCFQLNEDSTFIYEYRLLHAYEYSTGLWKKGKGKTIILNSSIANTTVPIKVEELGNLKNVDYDLLTVDFNASGNLHQADYRCRVFINDKLYTVRRCDSLASVQVNSIIHSIFLQFFREPRVITSDLFSLHPISTDTFSIKKDMRNNLKIYVDFNDSLFSYKSFNGITLKVKTNGIKLFNSYNDKWERIPKLPNTAKIFVRY